MSKGRTPKPGEKQDEFGSLFGEVLDWMLAPFLLLWPISIALIHGVANNIADLPYDQALGDNVRVVARLVRVADGRVGVNFPEPARDLLRADDRDTVYFQVLGPKGDLVAGDNEIPRPDPPEDFQAGDVYFRDAEIHGEDVRVAYTYVQSSPGSMRVPQGLPAVVTVQVAETRNKRSALVSRIISGVTLPQFAIIPLTAILVWIGLSRGIEPLNRLCRLIRRRRPSDLSPIGTAGIPEEVSPLILAFNDMMARLEQNLQAQQRFIADAAHQMRTPLTGLKMQTDLALVETDPEQLRRSLRQIAASADRAAHLINQLLALARAESSHEKIHAFERVDLDNLLRDATRDWVPRALEKNIDLGFESTGWTLGIDGNPLLLRQLANNLIDNALKYTPEGGRVTVRARATEFAVLEVEDNGIGIAENEHDLVFERFYRVLGSGADGSGLGLAIVREIAELHRANVLLKPNPNERGTVAQVVFPRHRVLASPSLPESPDGFRP
jgi:two-component system sensor histidine kinase TctE